MISLRVLVALTLIAAPAVDSALAEARKSAPRAKQARAGYTLARSLDGAMQIDAQGKGLIAQRRAAAARYATANSISPGSPFIAGQARKGTGGFYQNLDTPEPPVRHAREAEVEVGMPLWLPGQSSALRETVDRAVLELDERIALRRLDVAGRIRDAWWNVQRTARELEIERERVATARDIEHDISRRADLGDTAHQDKLLARNETLSAETEFTRAEAAARAARDAFAVLTGGPYVEGALEPTVSDVGPDGHPAVRAATAALARAEANVRLVDATPIENPEVGVFGRRDYSASGYAREGGTTVGFRFRMPLPTAGRNEPRKAEAEAETDRAEAELAQTRRLVAAEIAAARKALEAARRAEASAVKRLATATEQFDLALKSLKLGEIGAFDLYRVRQMKIDAQRSRVALSIEAGQAMSRLNQARGYAP
ncbi:MAG: TolC family protein [Beijerinckiaceae bacterium]|mgnify:CR=1 FL=1